VNKFDDEIQRGKGWRIKNGRKQMNGNKVRSKGVEVRESKMIKNK
jgi:hypothetical protein